MTEVAIRISSIRGHINDRQAVVFPGPGVLILRGEIYAGAKFRGGRYQPASPDDLRNFPWSECRLFRHGLYATVNGGQRDYAMYRAGVGLTPGSHRFMSFFLHPDAAGLLRMWVCMCKLKILKLKWLKLKEARLLALMMAFHPRLGAGSCLGPHSFSLELLQKIVRRKLM